VSNVVANSNGGFGIFEVDTATDSRASFNSGTGISALHNASNCVAVRNGRHGTDGFIPGGVISHSTAFGNALRGLTAGLVVNSSAIYNGAVGVYASLATGCTATGNGDPQILAAGIAGHNICPAGPCP
jgi:hypothetical protein